MAKNSSTTASNGRNKNGKHKQDAGQSKSDQAAKRTKSSRNKDTPVNIDATGVEVASKSSAGTTVASEHASATPATSVPNDTSVKLAIIQSTSEPSNARATAAVTVAPKLLPRVVVASGFLPRKVLLKKTTASSSIASGGSRIATSGTAGVTISSTTSTIFRAKDIVRNTIPPSSSSSSSSQSFHTHNASQASQASHQHHQSSSRPMNGHMQQDQAGNDPSTSLVEATAFKPLKPIVVIPEQHPDRVVFPYGNYPTYYEKRSQEQSKPKTTGKQDSAASTSASESSNTAAMRQQAKPPKWRQEEQYPKPQHSFNRGLSVLLPPSAPGHERSSSGSNSSHEDGLTVRDLAKKVDLRLEFLEPSWFRGKRVLDIGCNAALLSVFIAMHYKPCKIQGVDIDPSLIVKAEKFVRQTYSQISPQAYSQQTSTPSTREPNQDKACEPQEVPYASYFPKALQLMHGWLPIPQKTEQTQALFPHNIEFRVADWVTETANRGDSDVEQWDVIIGFSLTKWIHLHHGDDGIKRFFRDVYRSLTPGGLFLVEPQAYNTYNRRSKILPKMKENYKAMTFMPEHFRDYLLSDEVGFREGMLLGHSEGNAKNFNRDIYSFRK